MFEKSVSVNISSIKILCYMVQENLLGLIVGCNKHMLFMSSCSKAIHLLYEF